MLCVRKTSEYPRDTSTSRVRTRAIMLLGTYVILLLRVVMG